MEVRMPDGSQDTIRLLGVDTPETSASETSPDEWEGIPDNSDGRAWLTSWGNDATAYAEDHLAGEEIYIETDSESDRRGTYDRLLVYASQSESADTSFNLRLIEDGYARMYDTQFTQRSTYEAAESQAQNGDVGVWNYDATDTSTPTAAPDGGQQSGSLTVSGVHADADGNDHENLNDEYVEFTNDGESAIDMSGWTLSDQADHTYQFPSGFTLGAGDSVTIYTGSGSDTEDDLYWGSGRAVWNNGGDTIYVTDDAGETVIEHVYDG
ncbi:lamin tail domain-containing protein [Natronomonas salina]|nr:lamin tail domain-containing protein [Natronomonas salina]